MIDGFVNKVILGDCRKVMREWPDGCIDMILTDPPWMVYQEVAVHRAVNPVKYKNREGTGRWDVFSDEEEYWKFTEEWVGEAARVLKDRGHMVVFFDMNKTGQLIDLCGRHGLTMRQHLFWLKSNPVPRAGRSDFMTALEHAVWFTKGSRRGATFNYHYGQQPNYVVAPIPQHPRYHPTEKPVKVLEVWIKYLSNEGDIVLDPLCGSGSTLVAARKLKRKYIGIDINEEYCEIARRRLAQVPELTIDALLFP